MGTELQRKYGLLTAMAMVVGIVIGSGVFFKAEKILVATGGDTWLGILAWLIGGVIMISCAYTFAILATRYEKVNGIVDYAESALGEAYGYYVGWFMTLIYYPTLTGVLAWVSARYTCVLLGWEITGPQAMIIAGFYLVAIFALNALSPILAGKFQVSTTVIKLIPLLLMAFIGTVSGLSSGVMMENFTSGAIVETTGSPLFVAVVATAFAYEGWIIATSINSELKDAKKNLPKALLGGTFLIMAIYILYYVGIGGVVPNAEMMAGGEEAAKSAFQQVFGQIGGTGLFVLIVISCLGTTNGLMVGCTRGMYSIAKRGRGLKPSVFARVDKEVDMPLPSAIVGLLLSMTWLLYFYGANLTEPWFGKFCVDTSELPIVTIYALYIPIFIMMMKKEKELNGFKRFVMPTLALLGSLFMVIAAIYAHRMAVLYYLIIFVVIMIIGVFFSKKRNIEYLEA